MKDGGSVLHAPGTSRVSKPQAVRRMPGAPALRRDLSEDFAEPREEYAEGRGLRFRLRTGVPRSAWGRGIVGGLALAGIVAFTAAVWEMRSMLLHEPRLVIESSSAIQITGNRHLTRPQLLSVFGEDVDRNILTVPLDERRAELERLPWVEHATVMRLLPNRFRVAIAERTPVAFVRQGKTIGLVDAHGVLLDMAPDADGSAGAEDPAEMHYSFPVVTGVSQTDPLTTRAARMKLFRKFEAELDSGGEKISSHLSEVDLSNPEDVKALIPAGKSDVLVHFGDGDFLRRYELFAKNLPGWQAAHPRLASADMRYEHQVVLEMEPGTGVGTAADGAKDQVSPSTTKPKPVLKAAEVDSAHPLKRDGLGTPNRPAVNSAAPASHRLATPSGAVQAVPAGGHLQTAFDVPPKAKAAEEVPR